MVLKVVIKYPVFYSVTVSLYIKTMNGYCIENLSKFKYGFCSCRICFLVRYLIKGKPSLTFKFKNDKGVQKYFAMSILKQVTLM